MNSTGRFITFEGGEGVGKSTQIKLLAQKLTDLGQKVCVTREPGGEKIGEQIREILKSSNSIDPICETLLIFAARRDHFVKLICPWLHQGCWVICDRFYDSSLVYQGLLKKVSIENIMLLKHIAIEDFEPDVTIILDTSPDVSIHRIKSRNLVNDEYDDMGRQKHDLIRKGFHKIAEIFSLRSILINAEGSEKAVFSRIWRALEKRIYTGRQNKNQS
ncbi:MAG: dTMP kinase [Holosporaceae bacterium]|jgi:dTMP kinase|nr:dTMP kinase [Holosporaceae bacterium]